MPYEALFLKNILQKTLIVRYMTRNKNEAFESDKNKHIQFNDTHKINIHGLILLFLKLFFIYRSDRMSQEIMDSIIEKANIFEFT